MLNMQGGYQTDCTVTRLGKQRLECGFRTYFVLIYIHASSQLTKHEVCTNGSHSFPCRFLAVCPSAQASHIAAWLKRNIPSSVEIKDNTSRYCVIGLMGPKARELLQLVTSTNLGNSNFPYGTCQVCIYYCSFYIVQ